MYVNLFLTTGAFVNSIYVVGGPLYKHLDMYVCMYVCAVHWGMFSTPGGCSVPQGDIMSTLGGYHEYTGGYHDKCGGRSLEKQLNLYGNTSVLNIPWYTHDIPHIYHGISQCTEHSPLYSPHSSWYPPAVLIVPHCTEHPLVYSGYP